MKKKNKLEMIEVKVCKITKALAHEECPDGCPTKVRRKVPINRIPKEYKLKIHRDNLYVYWVAENISKSKNGKYDKGEIKEILDKCKFISNKFSLPPNLEDSGNPFPEDPYPEEEYEESDAYDRHDIAKLRKCLNRMNERKKKAVFFSQTNPKPISDIEAYAPAKEFFGSEITYEHIKSKIENQIATDKGRHNEIINQLRKNYRLNKKDFEIFWDWIEKDKEFIKQTRALDRLLSEHQPLKRTKEIKKPFQFNMSQVLVARKMEIISPEESQVLKFRYNLERQGTKSLRMIAGLIGVSHTTIRNMENSALKKMKEHMSKIKKSIPIKEPLGREATPKEYKEMYRYYSDLGKK